MSAPLPEQIDRIRQIDELKAQGWANDEAIRLVLCKETHMQRRQQAVRTAEYERHRCHDDAPPAWAMSAALWLMALVGVGLALGVAAVVAPRVGALVGRAIQLLPRLTPRRPARGARGGGGAGCLTW